MRRSACMQIMWCSSPPQYMVLLLLGLCLYDIVAVFITPYFTAVRGEGGREGGEGREAREGSKGGKVVLFIGIFGQYFTLT